MPNYTLCLLLRVNLQDSEREKFLQELTKTLLNSSKPEVILSDSEKQASLISWGKRDLAYPIQKETAAFYYLLNFEADGATPSALDKKLKLTREVLRFLVVRRKKKLVKTEAVVTTEKEKAKPKKKATVSKQKTTSGKKQKTKSDKQKTKMGR